MITAIDGAAVTSADDVLTVLERLQPGDAVELTLWRAGATRRQKATLATSDE
ncbi:hypothetical protein [Variovorax paradoxus]|uniref:hypothetical protein n=1 Tax=Variovorax paradoxus TaxID=34073 RepID=UPI0038D1411A